MNAPLSGRAGRRSRFAARRTPAMPRPSRTHRLAAVEDAMGSGWGSRSPAPRGGEWGGGGVRGLGFCREAAAAAAEADGEAEAEAWRKDWIIAGVRCWLRGLKYVFGNEMKGN